jgi:hypothetical protein
MLYAITLVYFVNMFTHRLVILYIYSNFNTLKPLYLNNFYYLCSRDRLYI